MCIKVGNLKQVYSMMHGQKNIKLLRFNFINTEIFLEELSKPFAVDKRHNIANNTFGIPVSIHGILEVSLNIYKPMWQDSGEDVKHQQELNDLL